MDRRSQDLVSADRCHPVRSGRHHQRAQTAPPPASSRRSTQSGAEAESARKLNAPLTREPIRPSTTNVGRQDQIVPKFQKLIDVDVETNVLRRPFSHYLLVHPGAIPAITEVVGL